jgi:hypothetical protein
MLTCLRWKRDFGTWEKVGCEVLETYFDTKTDLYISFEPQRRAWLRSFFKQLFRLNVSWKCRRRSLGVLMLETAGAMRCSLIRNASASARSGKGFYCRPLPNIFSCRRLCKFLLPSPTNSIALSSAQRSPIISRGYLRSITHTTVSSPAHSPLSTLSTQQKASCPTAVVDMAVRAVAEVEEDILMGTNHMAAAVTTPVAIPTGMTTYGLDIVVKSNASRCFGCRDAIRLALSSELSRSHRHSGQQHSLFSFHQTRIIC